MRGLSIAVFVATSCSLFVDFALAAPAAACKECGDHRSRCMKNYPGPTCKIDYDICMKACAKK